MHTFSFIIHVKSKYFYEDIAHNIKKCFDTSNYNKNDNGPLPKGMNKKVLG